MNVNRPRPLTSQLAAGALALALAAGLWLTLRAWPAATATACTFGRPAPPGAVTFAPTAPPPTGPPAPTEAPAATSLPFTPEGDFATQAAGDQATIVARGTQSPFATAQPIAVQAGQPSVAIARRGGLTLQVRLPKDAYLNGEAGLADATLSNDGPDTLFVGGEPSLFWTTLLDAQGHEPPPWPSLPGFIMSYPPILGELAPGQSVTDTVLFHVSGPAPAYAFWAETRFSRATAPTNPPLPDNIWLRLEAGPIPLRVFTPAPSQKLQAQLQTDRAGWDLRVTDVNGQAPAGPLMGMLEMASANGSQSRPLADSPDGTWSAGWGGSDVGAGTFRVRAWVAAPGYVTAAVTQTIDGPADAATPFYTGNGLHSWTYPTLAGAQAELSIPLYRLAGAESNSVQADEFASNDFCSITTHQAYHLPAGAWLELEQFYTNPPDEYGGGGDARFDIEAQVVSVAGQPAYLIEQFGWWHLDWKFGNKGFELRAPVQGVSSAELLALAASVRG